MKKRSILVLLLLLVALVLAVCMLYPGKQMTSTTSQFTVTKKYEENDQLWIRGHDPQAEPTKEIRMIVREREAWEAMMESQTYTLTYSMQGNSTPEFVEFVQER